MMTEDTQAPAAAPDTEARGDMKRETAEVVKMVVLFLLVFWGLKALVIEGYEVQGDSMAPTLADRERILVFKLPAIISRLPIVGGFAPWTTATSSSESTVENNKRYIKRVIAQGPPVRGGSNTVSPPNTAGNPARAASG